MRIRPLASLLAATLFLPASVQVSLSEDHCKFDTSNKVFDRRTGPALSISSKPLTWPPPDASISELKQHFVYSHIFGRWASRQVRYQPLNRCLFLQESDASGSLEFELVSTNSNIHDECSLNRCAAQLANILESAAPDAASFLRTTEQIANRERRFAVFDPNYPKSVLDHAALLAFRHIYPAGTRARIFVDLTDLDYSSARLSDFSSWLDGFQQSLRSADADNRDGVSNLDQSPQCTKESSLDVRRVDIDDASKGHEAIILINHGYGDGGGPEINYNVLKRICEYSENDAPIFSSQELGGAIPKLECGRTRIHRDRWLLIHARDYKSINASLMAHLVNEIRQELASEPCVNKDLAIYIANFR